LPEERVYGFNYCAYIGFMLSPSSLQTLVQLPVLS